MKTIDILGFPVFSHSISSCIMDITASLEASDGVCRWGACLNPHSYAVACNDEIFANSLRRADWIVPDGVGILIAGRVLGRRFEERITGFDLFEGVMRELNDRGGRVFFLGSSEETLSLISKRLPIDYPQVHFAGSYSPPFAEEFSVEENERIFAAIAAAGPDVLWVGLTAPKQEKWISEHQLNLPVKFVGAIGAVFDFYSGQVRRSPEWMRNLGIEWLPRLLQQPRRLWRRMFISAPVFIWHVLLTRIWRRRRSFSYRKGMASRDRPR